MLAKKMMNSGNLADRLLEKASDWICSLHRTCTGIIPGFDKTEIGAEIGSKIH